MSGILRTYDQNLSENWLKDFKNKYLKKETNDAL